MEERLGDASPLPVDIVGSSTFGISTKISAQKTYNMYETDGWMASYIGFLSIYGGFINGNIRRIFSSVVSNLLVIVSGDTVYSVQVIVDYNSFPTTYQPIVGIIGTLNTVSTPVYMAEDVSGNILISDTINLNVYSPQGPNIFYPVSLAAAQVTPGYVWFHDNRFIMTCSAVTSGSQSQNFNVTPFWILSEYTVEPQPLVSFPGGTQFTGIMSSKAGFSVGGSYVPSKGNLILVMGQNVTEAWFDVGAQLFPYQKSTAFNIDYGCTNPDTIARLDQYVVWLGTNEQTSAMLFMSDGGVPKPIVTDGIDRLLSTLQFPNQAEAYIFRRNNRIFYHINFTGDNFSLFYDIQKDKIYHASDKDFNCFPLSQVVMLNNEYYAISTSTNLLYVVPSDVYTQDGFEAPYVRVGKTQLLEDQSVFIANDIGFTIREGDTIPQYRAGLPYYLVTQDQKFLITSDTQYNLVTSQNDNSDVYYPRVDFCFSIDGGYTYSQIVGYDLNALGMRQNMLRWWGMGRCNSFTPQFRFYGVNGFVCTDGILNIRQ